MEKYSLNDKILINLLISLILMCLLLHNFTQFSSNLGTEYSYIEYQKGYDLENLNITGEIDYNEYKELKILPDVRDIENPKLKRLYFVNMVIIILYMISVLNFLYYIFKFKKWI